MKFKVYLKYVNLILSIHHNKCNFQIQQKDWVGAAIISDGYHRVNIQIQLQWKFEIQSVFVQRGLNIVNTSHRVQFSIWTKKF